MWRGSFGKTLPYGCLINSNITQESIIAIFVYKDMRRFFLSPKVQTEIGILPIGCPAVSRNRTETVAIGEVLPSPVISSDTLHPENLCTEDLGKSMSQLLTVKENIESSFRFLTCVSPPIKPAQLSIPVNHGKV